VVSITDSFGYASSAAYDPRFGQAIWSKDINGNYQKNTYDDFGRMTAIYGPNAVNSASGGIICPPTISFTYTAPRFDSSATPDSERATELTSPASAVTQNRADTSKGCTSDTIGTATFADGMKRIIQTRKDAEIKGTPGVIVSGAVEFDSLGRVVKQGQPVPGKTALGAYEELSPWNPTVFAYDTLDRTTGITTPDGALTTTEYGFSAPPQGGGKMFMTTVNDPNTRVSNPRTGKGIKISYKDAHEKILAVQEYKSENYITTQYAYNVLGEITAVTDAKDHTTTIDYDLLGRRLSIDNLDTGLTKYTYDANGNVTTKETAELRTGAKLIEYQYDYNRLTKINYPVSADVVYEYGSPSEGGDQNGNLAGRIKQVTDESGSEQRWYGRLGETVKELKRINASNNPVAGNKYETDYVFDSFGRMKEMTYPDGEVLSYAYDKGGLLNKAVGSKRQNPYKYINAINYDGNTWGHNVGS
jgi:YD repeat-containing protein